MKTKSDIMRQIEILKAAFLKSYVSPSMYHAMLRVIQELEAKIEGM